MLVVNGLFTFLPNDLVGWIQHTVYFIIKGFPGKRTSSCLSLCSACCRTLWKEGYCLPRSSWKIAGQRRNERDLVDVYSTKVGEEGTVLRKYPTVAKSLIKTMTPFVRGSGSCIMGRQWRVLVVKQDRTTLPVHLIKENNFPTVLMWCLCIFIQA